MAHIRLVGTMEATSLLPEDRVVTGWSIDAEDAPDISAAVDIVIAEWYDALSTWISARMSRASAVHRVEVYAMADPEPRLPILTVPFSLGAAGSASQVPAEVALCSSYRAGLVSGVDPARRRGRIYFGPLTASALGGSGRPATGLITALRDASYELHQALQGNGTPWQVWSRTDDVIRTITYGWVDDEFDTQRRRGQKPSTRMTWTA